MRRWQLLVGTSILALLGVAAWLPCGRPLPSRPGITKAKFDRVEVGMKLREVEVWTSRLLGYRGFCRASSLFNLRSALPIGSPLLTLTFTPTGQRLND
jgi:hypothetical protein